MITATQIVRFRNSRTDQGPTEQLKAEMARSRRERRPFYLTKDQLGRIEQWKLGHQAAQQQTRRDSNTEEIVRMVTSLALAIHVPRDKAYEIELRMGILCTLRGVEVPVASAVLGLAYPEEYAAIDFRVWRQLFGESKWSFTIDDYKRYLEELRLLAEDLGWPVQEVDDAIWAYDVRLQKRGRKTGYD